MGRVILRVTAALVNCNMRIASDRGHPCSVSPLIARMRSPTWRAPVLKDANTKHCYPITPSVVILYMDTQYITSRSVILTQACDIHIIYEMENII